MWKDLGFEVNNKNWLFNITLTITPSEIQTQIFIDAYNPFLSQMAQKL